MQASTYFIIAGAIMAFSYAVQLRLKNTYARWGRTRNAAGVTGSAAARRILDANGMRDVRLEAVRGQLSDHYRSAIEDDPALGERLFGP